MADRSAPDLVAQRFVIRAAELGDAADLGRIHVQIWREAYTGLMPQSTLDALDASARGDGWAEILAAQMQGDRTTLVAAEVDSGALVGFVTAGAARDTHPPAAVELWALNTLAATRGTGLGSALLSAALPPGPTYLWVLQGNERAIGFYRKHGFELDGVTRHDPDHGVDDLRMVRGG